MAADGAEGRDEAPAPWRVEAQRIVHRDRWVSLRADTCRTASGAIVEPYYVHEYPDWTAVVAIDREDRLVLVEQYRHAIGQVTLGLPGGMIDAGETPLDAARRELAEETGFEAAEWQAVATLATNPASLNNWCHVLLATGATPSAAARATTAEITAAVRLPIGEAIARARAGGLVHGVEVGALALALTQIGRWPAG